MEEICNRIAAGDHDIAQTPDINSIKINEPQRHGGHRDRKSQKIWRIFTKKWYDS